MADEQPDSAGSGSSFERMVHQCTSKASEQGRVADSGTSDLTIVPLGECDPNEVADFIAGSGVSRFLCDEPYVGGVPGAYLLQRIRDDASGDDAVALGARRKGFFAGLVVVRFPAWDREHFGFDVARVEHLQGADKDVLQRLVDATIVQLRARRVGMCSARLSSDALTALHCLESSGFRYVELTLAPWRDLSTWEPKGFGVTRPAETRDLGPVCDIARTVFRTDRFHRDLRFDRAAADSVYEKWVCSWYADQSPSRFSRVLVLNGEVAGFFMFELLRLSGRTGDVVAGIVLNGVDSSRSGLGYGFKMYCDALDVASEAASYATTTVTAANPAVLNLYGKLGFRFTSGGEVTMHWWSGD